MDITQVITLALVQGLTEFLPVSSSAHLLLLPKLLGWPQQTLAFDVAVHLGTLFGIVTYFRKDIVRLLVGWSSAQIHRKRNEESDLVWGLVIATIPVCIVGLLLQDVIELYLRSATVLALATIFFGLLLLVSDLRCKGNRTLSQLRWYHFLLIGLMQVFALIPGTSRAGVTITAALALGLPRQAAARLSLLLSMPVIFLSAGLVCIELLQSPDRVDWWSMAIGMLISGAVAMATVSLFLRWVASVGLLPFVIYRLGLGLALLYYLA